jgi:outer membrane protein
MVMVYKWIIAICVSGTSATLWAAPGELDIGLGAGSYDAAYRGLDSTSGVFPLVHYEGERLSIEFTTLSYRFLQEGPIQLSAVGSARFDGYDPKDSQYLMGMRRRSSSFDVGLQAGWENLQLNVLTDAGNKHKGTEASLQYSDGFKSGDWMFRYVGKLTWQNSKLTDYYYGVRPSEQAVLQINGHAWQRPAYTAGDAVIPSIGAMTMYNFAEHWMALAGVEVGLLPDAIKNSPIVDGSSRWGAFAGLAYRF